MSGSIALRENEDVNTLPCSARFVYYVLCRHERMSLDEISRETGVSYRTVRTSTKRLCDLGVVEWLRNPRDARRRLYRVVDRERDSRE